MYLISLCSDGFTKFAHYVEYSHQKDAFHWIILVLSVICNFLCYIYLCNSLFVGNNAVVRFFPDTFSQKTINRVSIKKTGLWQNTNIIKMFYVNSVFNNISSWCAKLKFSLGHFLKITLNRLKHQRICTQTYYFKTSLRLSYALERLDRIVLFCVKHY